jgi:hypothetical protein
VSIDPPIFSENANSRFGAESNTYATLNLSFAHIHTKYRSSAASHAAS